MIRLNPMPSYLSSIRSAAWTVRVPAKTIDSSSTRSCSASLCLRWCNRLWGTFRGNRHEHRPAAGPLWAVFSQILEKDVGRQMHQGVVHGQQGPAIAPSDHRDKHDRGDADGYPPPSETLSTLVLRKEPSKRRNRLSWVMLCQSGQLQRKWAFLCLSGLDSA